MTHIFLTNGRAINVAEWWNNGLADQRLYAVAKGFQLEQPAGTVRPSGLLPGEGDVGTYGSLKYRGSRGDNITPHHIPPDEYMINNGPEGYKTRGGVAINMEHYYPENTGRHTETSSYGSTLDPALKPGEALEQSISDVRTVYENAGLYGDYIEQQLQKVIEMNKEFWPGFFE